MLAYLVKVNQMRIATEKVNDINFRPTCYEELGGATRMLRGCYEGATRALRAYNFLYLIEIGLNVSS